MHLGGVLDNGEPQAASTCVFGPALLNAEEPLEHALAQLVRNAAARIAHAHHRMAAFGSHLHHGTTALVVVAHRVLRKVAHHLLKDAGIAAHLDGLVIHAAHLNHQVNARTLGQRAQTRHSVVCHRFKRHFLMHVKFHLPLAHLIQVRERDDLFHHALHLLGFVMDEAGEPAHVARLGDAFVDDFSIPRDDGQGRFELV